MRAPRFLALALALAAGAAQAAPRLEYHGRVLPERQVETLLAPALRAPADSAALARGLSEILARLQDLGHTHARVAGRWADAGALALEVSEGPRLAFTAISVAAPTPEDSASFAGRSVRRPMAWSRTFFSSNSGVFSFKKRSSNRISAKTSVL